MNNPLLSIVVPTRNRPELLLQTISSILDQSFRELEVVIIDNSDNEESQLALAGIVDQRLRVLRTGGLSMPENWDFALKSSHGRFVMMSNDKTELRRGAAEKIVSELLKSDEMFLTWVIGPFTENSADSELACPAIRVNNVEVLAEAGCCRIDKYQRLAPRGTNCAVQGKFLREQFARYGSLCRPVSPDYSLSVFLLAGSNSSLHLPVCLGSVVPFAPSNTHVAQDAPEKSRGYYSTLKISEEDMFRHVPLRTFLINNILLEDILATLVVVKAGNPNIDQNEYVLMLLSDLIILKREGRPWRTQAGELRNWVKCFGAIGTLLLVKHICMRFFEGWPNRRKRMRENFPDVVKALRFLIVG